VTGGAGFIGSHVVDALLADGRAVTVIDDLSTGDAREWPRRRSCASSTSSMLAALEAVVAEAKPSAIFHLAAQASVVASVEDPGRDCEVNVKGTLNVVEAAGRCGAPVVFTSTGGALYGDDAPMPTGEDRIPAPLSPYGASKWAAEAYVKTWSLSSGIPHAVCRLGNVYGPRQSPHGEAGVVAIFSHHLYTGRAPKLYGQGKPTRDYVYVGDVVSALLAASGRRAPTTSPPASRPTCDRVARAAQGGGQADRATSWPTCARASSSTAAWTSACAERELGWRAEVPIAEGLRLTYEALVEEFERG
jgi:UDP-glucose 4-epimerase